VLAGLTAWCGSLTQLFVLRVLLGAGEAVNTPAGMRWIRLNFPPERHGLVMGLYKGYARDGPASGAPIVACLLIAFGWRAMFAFIGFGALLTVASAARMFMG